MSDLEQEENRDSKTERYFLLITEALKQSGDSAAYRSGLPVNFIHQRLKVNLNLCKVFKIEYSEKYDVCL